jgi:hypothetical protein
VATLAVALAAFEDRFTAIRISCGKRDIGRSLSEEYPRNGQACRKNGRRISNCLHTFAAFGFDSVRILTPQCESAFHLSDVRQERKRSIRSEFYGG